MRFLGVRNRKLLSGEENYKGKRVVHKMKKLILLLLISQTVFIHQLFAQEAVESNADKGVRHEFVIANFRTESGVVRKTM